MQQFGWLNPEGFTTWKSEILVNFIHLVTFLGWLSDPFKGLSDLQLGDEKVTLNHLAHLFNICRIPLSKATFGFTTGIFEGL